MDYYQPPRPHGSAPQTNQQPHYVYSQTNTSASNSTPMYYQQTMSHQPQSTYQTHYVMPAASGNTSMTSMDYVSVSQHSQSAMAGPAQSGNVRGNRITNSGMRSNTGNGQSSESSMTQAPRFQQQAPAQQTQDLPLRIVIDSKHVGAIIGTGGCNIREITKESKAKVVVDVQRVLKDQQGHSEKIISIIGSQENCSKACSKILEVVQRELEKSEVTESHEVELKIRAHNQLVGRLIGKGGSTIKKIMQDTSTTIFISNTNESRANELAAMIAQVPDLMLLERTITVKGPSIENVSAAEAKISTKLRQSYENDVNSRLMMGPMPSLTPLGAPFDPYSLMSNIRPPHPIFAGSNVSKVIKMWVPNTSVGAIIGAKGGNIRNIMRNSGANVRIDGGDKKEKNEEGRTEESLEHQVTGDDIPQSSSEDERKEEDRMITITGNEQQILRAQFWIWQRIAEQEQKNIEEIRLRSELNVPSRLVGRIIGKGGQNVRELQRITGAMVKIPEEEHKLENGEELKEGSSGTGNEGTVVRIVGPFQATQHVLFRVGQLVSEYNKSVISDKRREEAGDVSQKESSPPAEGDREE